ncbi:MAG: hypothetical protein G3M70_02450 [Candidatus Nitronauta litoralis]|uniref:Uncharacterized protein n=1 Tax=Candidatus Nitronauta litoralis TaxID=2705533 RepID=A0A7T0BU17_9BACT|nr:MAG: hypothetical protein G3M70_02450 [Candidatus Nitronauta litoralis]
MDQDALAEAFSKIKTGAQSLKEVAQNRHDRDFDSWQRQSRNLLLRYAPVKIPAFDEIRFASDFFLGKPESEQIDINDRIALISDIDLALEILEAAREHVFEELRLKKSRERIKGGATLELPEECESVSASLQNESKKAENLSSSGLDSLPAIIEGLEDFTRREKEEALEEINRVRQVLDKEHPDWDRVKRTIKFFLDFDKTLALAAVPLILKRYQDLTNR